MDDNEFQELQMFGHGIDVKLEEKTKIPEITKPDFKKLKIKKGKTNYVRYFKKALIWLCEIFKRFGKKLGYKTKTFFSSVNEKFCNFFKKISLWKNNRQTYSLKKSLKQNSDHIGYKIVEFKKEKRNKIVVVRKRIPYIFNPANISNKKTEMGSMYYLSLTGEDENPQSESYIRLKKSIWDFPHKK